MNRSSLPVPFGLLLILLSPLAARTADAIAGDSRSQQVDAIFSTWNKPGSPGCATGVMSQGKLLYARGYGLANVARGIALSPDTVFDIASMTKQFTAANIGLLILDGKLAQTDDIRAGFPELHLNVPVTVGNLIHHLSGLRDYAELNQLRGSEATDNRGVISLLERQKSTNFAPGSEFVYSNSNYVVLAELVQRATGKSLAEFSQQRIFGPLNMRSTRYAASLSEDPPTLANSYLPSGPGAFRPVTRAAQSVGDGNLLTTVRDLARWDENFYLHRVGGRALIELMRAPGRLADGKQVPYGFGLMFGEYRGLTTETHGGSYHGFRTELLRFPTQHFSVSVLCNVATANASGLAAQVADIYLAGSLAPQPAPAARPVELRIDPQAFDPYVGEYLLDLQGERHLIFVGRQGDRFFAQPVGEAPVELFAISTTEFFSKADNARAVFERAPDGTVSRVTLHRPAGDLVAVRIAAPAASPEALARYAGTYYSEELDGGLRLEVLGKRLVATIGNGDRFPLVQLAEDRFLSPGGATLEFRKQADGQVGRFDYSSARVRNLPFLRRSELAPPLSR